MGYIFMRLECEPAPMILGFVLGPLMEDNLRRAMRISGGDPMIFIHRPISLGLLIAAAVLLEHDPEKWEPVFGKRSCSSNELEQDDDSKKSHPALVIVALPAIRRGCEEAFQES